jgi:hypothetical protein
VDIDLAAAIRQGRRSFRELGMAHAYCGDPAGATAEEGQRLYQVLGEIVTQDCAAAWGTA